MEKKSEKKLNKRALVALVALISGIGLPFSGLATHLLHSSSLNGARHSWIVAHEVLGIIFMASSIWHIILNRKALVNHVLGSARRPARVSREALWAAVLVGIILLGALGHTLSSH